MLFLRSQIVAEQYTKVVDQLRTQVIPTPDAGAHATSRLSLVVPCFNEERVLSELHTRLSDTIKEAPSLEMELVCVDDGSTDGTLDVLRRMQRADSRVRVLALSRNYGQFAATTAGLGAATGDAVAIIDADLQDPPEVLLEMVARWREGAEVVHGVRSVREGETVAKRWTSKAFSRFINRVSEVSIPLDAGDFCLLDRKVVDAFLALPERDRYHRGMIAWLGFRRETVRFQRMPRVAGETKYTNTMMWRLALDGLLSFSLLPLRLAAWTGFVVAAASLLGVFYAAASWLLGDNPLQSGTMMFLAVLFLGGVQLVFIGILGEYVGRIYGEVKRRPLYLVRESLGFPEDTKR